MEFFHKLGSLVTRLWKERNCNEEDFPEVASRGLSELPPHQHVTFWDVAKWGLTCERLPTQADLSAQFGQPPLTVYGGREFRIEVLFWVHGFPAIHQHGFSGAFHVLHGSSLQSLWEFEPTEQVTMRLVIGKVSHKKAELLLKGDSRPIIAGNRLIHSTFHLDRPSLTVVVRTLGEGDQLPQYSYLPPTIAYAQDDEIPSVKRRAQLLRMLLMSGKRAEYEEITRHMLGTEDAYSVFQFLLSTFQLIEDADQRHNLLLAARVKHPKLIEALRPALLQTERRDRILKIRKGVSNSDLQFFLALLLNIPERSAILSLIKQRYPSRDPVTAILAWVRELSELGVLGARFPEPWLLMLRCLLMNNSDREIQKAFSDQYATEHIHNVESVLGELSAGLQDSWLLQPVFQG
jgi:hypothetical protein